MPVEAQPPHQPIGEKKAYVDLGVKVSVMTSVDGGVFGYRANLMLSDWWYWNHRIARHQSVLEDVKGGRTSKRLKTLYRKRRRRFRDHVNSLVSDFVSRCWREGVSEIVCGDLREVRKSANFSKKSNFLIHNFWSHGYVLRRIKEKAEEYGIRVTTVEERGTSSQCPRCGSKHMVRKGRLFRCLNCGLEAHRDAVGCVNIGLAQGEPIPAGVINRAVTRPTLLCVP